MPKLACLTCGTLSEKSRCPEHQAVRDRERARTKPGRAAYTGDWRARSRAARAEHVRQHGLACPGWGEDLGWHQVASASELTLDHDGVVLCRRHNSSKAGSYDKDQASPAAARRRLRDERG